MPRRPGFGLAPALFAAAALAAAGCGSATVHDLPPAAEPVHSPPLREQPAGRVVTVGPAPEGVAADSQTSTVAVALRDELLLLDGATGAVRHRVALPGGPRHLQLAGPRGPVLVPAEPANTVFRVALPSGHVLSRTRVGAYPHDVAAAGGRTFAGDERGNTVSVLDDGGAVTATFGVATQPGGVASVRNGGAIAVVSVRERVVELYDTRTLKPIGSAPAGVGPTHVVSDGRDHVWITDTQGGALLVYTLRPHLELERRVDLPGGPYGVAIDRMRHRLWVTLTASNRLVELPASGRPHVLRSLPAVRQPDTVAADDATGRVYVTGRVAGALQLVDP